MPIFARFPDKRGNITIPSHEGWTELNKVEQNVRCPVSMEVGDNCGQNYGKLGFDTLLIRLKPDGSIVPLHNHLYRRYPFDEEFQIDFCHIIENKARTYLSLMLDNVRVSNYRFCAEKDTQSIIVELAFSQIHTRYFPYDEQGNIESPSSMMFDLTTAA